MTDSVWPSLLGDAGFIPLMLTGEGRAQERHTGTSVPDERGRWVVIAPPQVRLHPQFGQIVLDELRLRPHADLLYGDEVGPGTGGEAHEIFLKPALNLALLIADDYVGSPLVVRASALRHLGGLRLETNTAVSYDLVLRAVSAGLNIGRITQILAQYTDPRPRPSMADRRSVLRAWLAGSADFLDVGDGLVPGTLRLQRRFASFPEVTLILPTRQGTYDGFSDMGSGRPMIINLLDNIPRTDWPMDKLHVLVGDALEDDGIYSDRRWPFHFRRIVTGSPCNQKFNYAAKANELWRAADTEHIVLMNDDIQIGSTDWLQALLTFSMQEDVGVVGARLLYPNGTLQHAGMPGGLFNLTAHAWLGQVSSAPTYQNWALVHREWSMVTGAVIATRKSVLEEINGFDEQFRLEFNDVDLCLRLRMLGYRNVYTPFAELIHYEKASRGELLPRGSELALFWSRWSEFLQQDPAYHPRLSRHSFQIAPTEHAGEWWQ